MSRRRPTCIKVVNVRPFVWWMRSLWYTIAWWNVTNRFAKLTSVARHYQPGVQLSTTNVTYSCLGRVYSSQQSTIVSFYRGVRYNRDSLFTLSTTEIKSGFVCVAPRMIPFFLKSRFLAHFVFELLLNDTWNLHKGGRYNLWDMLSLPKPACLLLPSPLPVTEIPEGDKKSTSINVVIIHGLDTSS